jgi:subtilisin family serine protease
MLKTKLKILLLILLFVTIAQANDKYIIFLQDNIDNTSVSNINETTIQIANRLLNTSSNNKNKIIQIYDKSLNGFSAKLDNKTAQELKYNPEVKLLKKDEINNSIDFIVNNYHNHKTKISKPIANKDTINPIDIFDYNENISNTNTKNNTPTSTQSITKVVHSTLDDDKSYFSNTEKPINLSTPTKHIPTPKQNITKKVVNTKDLKIKNNTPINHIIVAKVDTTIKENKTNEIDYNIKQEITQEIKATTYTNDISLALIRQSAQSWGLDRIDQYDDTLDYEYKYEYTGRGVHVYVIDTGINYDHNEFKGRIGNGIDIAMNDDIAEDCHGHGTHVAGTIAGTIYGVAKEAIIHPVKVLDCNGETTSIHSLSAIDWILENHTKPAVVNMSLGTKNYKIFNIILRKLTRAGITTVVAAGNDNYDACKNTPASEPTFITVASSTIDDEKSSFSNTGKCVDIFAPGSAILSAGIDGPDDTEVKRGTSMATPHVTGVVAQYLEVYPNALPSQVHSFIIDSSAKNKISGLEDYPNTPNRLLYSLIKRPPPLPPSIPIPDDDDIHNDFNITLPDFKQLENVAESLEKIGQPLAFSFEKAKEEYARFETKFKQATDFKFEKTKEEYARTEIKFKEEYKRFETKFKEEYTRFETKFKQAFAFSF